MDAIEVKTACRHLPLLATHPWWLIAASRGGRVGLLTRMVADSIRSVRSRAIPKSLDSLVSQSPCSPLGKMGATQEKLYFLVRMFKPATVVETGVFRGISSAFILAALTDNEKGKLYSIDLPNADYQVPDGRDTKSPLKGKEDVGFAVPKMLKQNWELLLGDSKVLLPQLLSRLDSVDLFYHDSDHSYAFMKWEFAQVYPRIPFGGFLTSDDVQWNTAFDEFVHDGDYAWIGILGGRLGIAQKGH